MFNSKKEIEELKEEVKELKEQVAKLEEFLTNFWQESHPKTF
jgi:polyhydroxyalkanoate synthesis regulator phasin